MAWLAGWLYRKELVLGSSVGATNYQFKILVGESASVTGSDVNCEACLPSFDDLRFTTDDEVTLLDYWIEGVSGATPLQTAIVWVKVPVISTTTTIFMYSGNASAPAVSNGVNTFLFFDTALSNGLSNYALDVIRPVAGSGDITWDGSSYSVNLTGTGHIYARITSLGSVKNIAVHADIYRQTNVSNQQGGIAYCVVNPDLYGMSRYVTTAADNLQLYHLAGGTSHIITYRLPQSTWTKLMVGVYGTTAKAIWKDINYNLISDLTATIPVSVAPGGWGLFSAYDSVAITRYRNIFARNFVYPEPELLYVDPVSADFTADTTSGFSPLLVGFTDQSLGNPTGWNWDFGDGSTSTDQNPVHSYAAPGVYSVSLTVTKDDVPSDTLVRTDYITINTTTYYIKDTGTEVFPYGTEETAARSLNRLTKQLQGYTFNDINQLVTNSGYGTTFNPTRIPPFPILSQSVEIKFRINQKDLETYASAPGVYFALPGTVFGPTGCQVGRYSFRIDSSADLLPGNPVIPYTCGIYRSGVLVTTFPKFTSGVSQTFSFVVKANVIELYVDDVWYYTDTHGVSSWDALFSLGTPPKFSIYEYNPSPNQTLVIYESISVTDRPYNFNFIDSNVIYIASDITEPSVNGVDQIPAYYTDFNGAIITSLNTRRSWSLGSDYMYLDLTPQNLDMQSGSFNYFYNPTKPVSGNIFRSFSMGLYFDDLADQSTVIRDNLFENSNLYFDEATIGIDLYRNFFNGESYAEVYQCTGLVSIYNNIFTNNTSSYAVINLSYYGSAIANFNIFNNTFSNLFAGVYAIYFTFYDDTGIYIDAVRICNNIAYSGDGFYFDLYVNDLDNIHTFVHSNNNCINYVYTNDSNPIALDPTEISADPQFEGVPPTPLKLLNTSPSYKTGLASAYTPIEDIIGVTRKVLPDMGAYETEDAAVVAEFEGTPLSGNQPLSVQFTDLSTPIGSITSWDWDFGDGTPHSTEQNPLHTYVLPGLYTVTLTVANAVSDNQIAKVNYIEVIAVSLIADFEGTPLIGNQPLSVQFTDLSTPEWAITGWDWDFGDSTPHSTEQNPTHSYTFPGLYTVTLRVFNSISDNTLTRVNYIEVVYNEGEVEPESPSGGGFTRSRGPTLIFD